MTASTTRASQIELCTRNTSSSAGPSAPSPKATAADAPRSLNARATSEPGSSRTRVAASSRSQRPKPSAGKRRATPSRGSASIRTGAPLRLRRRAHTSVPFVGELAQPWALHAPGVPGVEKHPPTAAMPDRCEGGAHGVLPAGCECRDARADDAVVLAPVAVPAPPHLVDTALRDLRAELRLVVDDGRLGEVVHVPAGVAQAELQVHLFGVEEELLVEQADLVERLAAEDECGPHHPVDRVRAGAVRLLDPQLPHRQQAERADERCREPPR